MRECKRDCCCNLIDDSNSRKLYCSIHCKQQQWKNNRRAKERNGLTYVYYLPEEHYIGMSNQMSYRMSRHRAQGKITDGMEVIAGFERRVDAAWLEVLFHQRGYNGFSNR